MTVLASSDELGALIAGRYRLESILGRGGMSIVYHARDERSSTSVALKRCALGDPIRLARYATLLEREYHTLTQLAHPHIIEVLDFGRDQLGPYYTMEYLEGQDLSNVEVLPWKETCAILRDIASALAMLHSRGLLHRDVALRNIHLSANGSAKLIDFGAMTSVGVSRDMVGTPPFMAPEVLQLQALDARADLFSLGAVGYRLLTGRHAFPARRFVELRDAWRSRPQAPDSVHPEIPGALSRLVLRLLSLDRGSRPQSAAEVITQLSRIAALPRENTKEISRAYLTTPTLVGRDAALLEVRRRMLSLVRGDGGALLIEGRAGSGRSRLLEACALEAKLLSVTVVRADARDARSGEWGTARALGAQLLELFPAQALEAARLSRRILAHVIDDLDPDGSHTATTEEPERSLVLRELRDWVLSLAKHHRLLIAVDDADQVDPSSAALLSALANKVERHPLLLAVTLERDADSATSASLQLLRDVATPIELEDIQAHDTEGLVRSLFGDAPNVDVCAARIHGLSNGNPRTTMELAQHLVDTGRAVYDGGSWVLPHVLDETELPRTLAASLAARISALSPDARELAGALALSEGTPLRIESYPALTSHGDSKRAFSALDELVAARFLTADAERYSFVQRGLLSVLQDSMSEAARKAAHLRIAHELAADWGDAVRRAEHLLAAGEDAAAIELLLKLNLATQIVPVRVLTAAAESAERLGMPRATVHRLRVAVLLHAPFSLAIEEVVRFAPVVVEQLEHDSGLERYAELADLPAPERLTRALMLTQQSFLETPEHERVHSVIDAIRELAQLCGSLSAMSVATQSLEALDILPSLEPLFPLSPTLPIVSQLVEAAKHYVHGQLDLSYALYEQIQRRIREPDRAGFEESQYDRMRYGIDYALGLLDARWGSELAEDRASALEENAELRVNAWRIRTVMNLARGNALEGRRCSRRAELLEAQDGPKERYGGTTIGVKMVLCASLDDLAGVKATLQPLAAFAAKHPGWRPTYMLGKACCASLQGDPTSALAHLDSAFELSAGRAWSFAGVAKAVRVRILSRIGRREEATSFARAALRIAREQQTERTVLGTDAAPLLAASGHLEEAEQTLREVFAHAEQARARGFAMGAIHEAAARVALVAGDVARFESHVASCTREYELSRNPALGGRLMLLFDEARALGVYARDAQPPVPPSIRPVVINTEVETIHSRIVECIDGSDRGRCALTLLLQATSSVNGYLYAAAKDDRMPLLAALPEVPPEQSVVQWVERCARSWLEPSNLDDVTESADPEQEVTLSSDEVGTLDAVPGQHTDSEGRHYTAVPLYDSAPSGPRRLAAVFVPEVVPLQGIVLPQSLTQTIARDLIEFGDADGWAAP